jgi:predicted NAD/FAD-binding protein
MSNLADNSRIAIIGSGISGLACGYFLADHHQIKLYEKNNYLGGHSNTVNINYDNREIAVDTGFIVFNFQTYPNLVNFFQLLKIEIEKSNMSFAVKIDNGKLEYAGTSLSGIFAQKKNYLDFKFYQMLYDIIKFNKKAIKILDENHDENYRLIDFLNDLKMKDYFKNYYLLPMASAIWSSPIEKIIDYPVKSFVNFFNNHGLLSVNNQPQWYTVKNGSRQYVQKIANKFSDKISLNDQVKKIYLNQQKKWIVESEKSQETFDKVILACHSDQALAMLGKANDNQRDLLANIKYQENIAILHKDQSVMPKARNAWASWVYSSNNQSKNILSVSYWMNNLQNIDNNFPLFVTLNPNQEINNKDIFAKIQYHHPVFDNNALKAQKKLSEIQGIDDLYFCGAYHGYGFHEDGLNSAIKVLTKMQIKIPWLNNKDISN